MKVAVIGSDTACLRAHELLGHDSPKDMIISFHNDIDEIDINNFDQVIDLSDNMDLKRIKDIQPLLIKGIERRKLFIPKAKHEPKSHQRKYKYHK